MALKPPLLEKTITEYDFKCTRGKERDTACVNRPVSGLNYFTEELGLPALPKKKRKEKSWLQKIYFASEQGYRNC